MKNETYKQLLGYIKKLKAVVVAFSGGVDSSLLAFATHSTLGSKMVAVTIKTPYIPDWEIEEACSLARKYGFSHEVLELEVPDIIVSNPPDRCYHCKKILFRAILTRAKELGIDTVIDGSNKDDLTDYRPGMRALGELHILSPLLELAITKESIRAMSRELGLETWNKPAYACLLSRIPYHTRLTTEELSRVANAEMVLRQLNIRGARVRSHGDVARIEVPTDKFGELLTTELRLKLVAKLQTCGYLYITLDLEGYQTGSLNKTIATDTENE